MKEQIKFDIFMYDKHARKRLDHAVLKAITGLEKKVATKPKKRFKVIVPQHDTKYSDEDYHLMRCSTEEHSFCNIPLTGS